MNNKLLPALAIAAAAVPAVSSAEVTGNIGWVSEYLYRGIFQDDSSASAGIDYTSDGGFYIGSWLADVGQGLEQDVYFGYSGGEDFTYTIGFTGYYYTDDFDDTYEEINLGIGYKMFALDVAVGEWDGFGQPADYTFASITISPEKGPYYKFGSFGDDFDGDYFEIGYSYDFMGVDLSVALVYSDDLIVSDPADVAADTDYQLTFGITKTFSFGSE
ncbi:MAG TPA: TorF family putative porin [Gammaproteobacteria bacterium]